MPLVVVDRRTMGTLEGRVLMHGEDERGGNAGRHYLMIEGTDAKVHLMYYTPEMEEARSRGGLRTNSFLRLRKLFVEGQLLIEIEDLGDSEAILRNRQHLSSTARNLIGVELCPPRMVGADGLAAISLLYQAPLLLWMIGVRQQARRSGANSNLFSGNRPPALEQESRVDLAVVRCYAARSLYNLSEVRAP